MLARARYTHRRAHLAPVSRQLYLSIMSIPTRLRLLLLLRAHDAPPSRIIVIFLANSYAVQLSPGECSTDELSSTRFTCIAVLRILSRGSMLNKIILNNFSVLF